MKILITGGLGFIGTNLIPRLLTAGHDISVIDNETSGVYLPDVHDNVAFYKTDIRDVEQVNAIFKYFNPDYVFHFAGMVSIYDCNKNPLEAVDNNIIGSTIIFDACVKYNVKKVIFSESSAVYEHCGAPPYNETQSDPTTIYAATKAAVATLANSYHRTKGLTYTALRYFNVAGPLQDYNRTVPPLFAGVILRHLGGQAPIVFGNGERRRDFIHVDDVNNFHLQCLIDCRTNNQTFNLGTGKSVSIFEIIKMVEGITGKFLNYVQFPEINGEAFEIYANIDKAMAIDWRPEKSIKDALIDTYEYLEKEVAAGKINPSTYMNNLNAAEDAIK